MANPTNPADQKDSLFVFPTEQGKQSFLDKIRQESMALSQAKAKAKPTSPSSLLGPNESSS